MPLGLPPPGIEFEHMNESSRSKMASLLLVVYLLITMSPLAPLLSTSPRLAHAMTGECVGDCDICGCSPERRASHTCCCWLNGLKHEDHREDADVPECCRKKDRDDTTKLSAHCPCGSSNPNYLWCDSDFDHIPYRFVVGVTAFHGDLPYAFLSAFPPRNHDGPPKPPPRLTILS